MNVLLEACVENMTEALAAEEKGAHRIELCDNLAVGGTTPSAGMMKICRKHLSIPIFVMIRPRGGNFVYSPAEQEIMKEDIKIMKDAGADGLVFGMLTPEGRVDLEMLYSFLELARPLPVTFHKAIDETHDVLFELGKLKDAGVDRVLSSGGAGTAREGAENLRKMIQTAGKHMKIVVAGKVTIDNLEEITRAIPAKEFHGRKIVGTLS